MNGSRSSASRRARVTSTPGSSTKLMKSAFSPLRAPSSAKWREKSVLPIPMLPASIVVLPTGSPPSISASNCGTPKPARPSVGTQSNAEGGSASRRGTIRIPSSPISRKCSPVRCGRPRNFITSIRRGRRTPCSFIVSERIPSSVLASARSISLAGAYSVVNRPMQSIAASMVPSSYRNSRIRASSRHTSRKERIPSMTSNLAPRSRTASTIKSRVSLSPFFTAA